MEFIPSVIFILVEKDVAQDVERSSANRKIVVRFLAPAVQMSECPCGRYRTPAGCALCVSVFIAFDEQV